MIKKIIINQFMLLNKYINLFLSIPLLTIIIIVVWYSVDNYIGFVDNHQRLSEHSVLSTGREIELFINERKRFVRLFAGREQSLLRKVTSDPLNPVPHKHLEDKINIYFPHRFAFTIADSHGQPLLKQGKEMIGKACQKDIHNFASGDKHPHIFVHPSPREQKKHFDIMALFNDRGEKSIFFVSFFLDDVFRLLDNGKVTRHHLFLVKHGDKRVIEASTVGAIDEYEDSGYTFKKVCASKAGEYRRLWPENLNGLILSSLPIPNTQWELIDIPEPSLFENYRMQLIGQATGIMLMFSLVTAAGFWMSRRIGTLSLDTNTVLTSVEEERQRIARDLHDQVLSDIGYIRRDCQSFCNAETTKEQVKTQATQVQGELEQITNTIRNIIDDLHPHSIEILGLAETIRSYCNKQSLHMPSLNINLNIENWDEKCLNNTERLNLFRIFQELLHNIVKHAEASRCEIKLRMVWHRLILVVEDNGTGLDPNIEVNKNGHGIRNIEARSRIINTKISWSQSEDGRGTRFSLDMPLADKQK